MRMEPAAVSQSAKGIGLQTVELVGSVQGLDILLHQEGFTFQKLSVDYF